MANDLVDSPSHRLSVQDTDFLLRDEMRVIRFARIDRSAVIGPG